MIFASISLIVISLLILEVSLLPHFLAWMSTPLLVLPFLAILSLKDRTIFTIIMASMMGIITDAITNSTFPIYLIAYLSMVLVSRFFMGRFISYGESRANAISVGSGLLIIYGLQIYQKIGDIDTWGWLIPLGVSIVITLLLPFLYTMVGHRYFSWIEKKTEERHR